MECTITAIYVSSNRDSILMVDLRMTELDSMYLSFFQKSLVEWIASDYEMTYRLLHEAHASLQAEVFQCLLRTAVLKVIVRLWRTITASSSPGQKRIRASTMYCMTYTTQSSP